MTKNRILRLKNKLIEDITNIERNKITKQKNLCSKIYFKTPYDRKMRELTEEMLLQQEKEMKELQKKYEKENEKHMQEMLEDMKKKR